MDTFDFNKVPKQHCDNVLIGTSQESFVMAFFSGANAAVFAFTPQHAKRLSQSLSHNLEQYEKRFGNIDAEWKPGIQSPIQITAGEK